VTEGDWLHHMRRGDFASAWTISDAVLRERAGRSCVQRPRHEQWIWDGTPLDGRRVLVRCYHGLGDTIQFIRYLPLVADVASRVTVWVQPALVPLVRGMPGSHEVLPLHDGAPDVAYDVDVEVMELPHVFRSTIDTIPRSVPYLHVEPAPVARDDRLAVGLVWQPGSWDERRAVPPALLRPLGALPGVQLHILQRGPALADRPPGLGVVSGSDDVASAARVVAALDLVISVDSMPAHLAGALGRPVWTLLHHDADWRWMRDRDDSPWYPTMRLFRQERAGEWAPVIARLAEELRRLTRTAAPCARRTPRTAPRSAEGSCDAARCRTTPA
jgi:hypothetical protein